MGPSRPGRQGHGGDAAKPGIESTTWPGRLYVHMQLAKRNTKKNPPTSQERHSRATPGVPKVRRRTPKVVVYLDTTNRAKPGGRPSFRIALRPDTSQIAPPASPGARRHQGHTGRVRHQGGPATFQGATRSLQASHSEARDDVRRRLAVMQTIKEAIRRSSQRSQCE